MGGPWRNIRTYCRKTGYGDETANFRCASPALASETLTPQAIFAFLDQIEGWGKQHAILYNGPKSTIEDWRNPGWVSERANSKGIGEFLNAKKQLAIPSELTLSSIEYDTKKLRVLAVERREGAVRDSDLDELDVREDDKVIFKAYRFLVYRGFIAFEWDLIANEAFIQITQLPTGEKYEDAITKFSKLLNGFVDLGEFESLSLRPVITRLHELEEEKVPEARSHGVAYRTPQGRTLEGRGAVGT